MKSLKELAAIRDRMRNKVTLKGENSSDYRIVVGLATCGIAAGATPVLDALVDEVNARNLKNVSVSQTGCIGICRLEPIIEVFSKDREKVTYVQMTDERARRVIDEHIINGNIITEYTIGANE